MKTYTIQPNRDYRDQSISRQPQCSESDVRRDAVRHYDECYWDYLAAWCNHENLALHYGYWDEDKPYRHHQALLNKNQVLYDRARIRPDDAVLDAGCGIGGSSIWMAKHYANTVTGVTLSAKQAEYAGRHAQRHGVADRVKFEVADFCQMPFEDASFDVVWALESSCHALQKSAFVKEAFRVLRPGGRLVVCDGFLLQREFSQTQWDAVLTCLNGWAVPNLSTQDEFVGYLQASGFRQLHVEDITPQTRASSDYMLKVAKRLYPVQKVSQWLGLRSVAQTANYQVGLAQHRFFAEHLIAYCIVTAEK